MMRSLGLVGILVCNWCFLGIAVGAESFPVTFEPVYAELSFKNQRPIALAECPDGSGRIFLVLQRGRILILPKDRASADAPVFLDFSDRKMEANKFEEGLLGLAFHPDYKANGKFYVYYSQQNPKRSVLSELRVDPSDPNRADPKTERVLLEIPQPFWNHNSGNLLFGQDGYLYVGVGDGGKADDLRRLAQNPWMLNGKILRIDVNGTSPGRQYAIPADNPLVGEKGVREEIYALGIRNPWGIHQDPKTDQFWFADVGQNQQEEINVLQKGGNYGWSYREGTMAFERRPDKPAETARFVEPVFTYGRTGGISITGGVVYRGKAVPALKDHYLFGDWGTGNVWALKVGSEKLDKVDCRMVYKRPVPRAVAKKKKMQVFQPAAFIVDANGEILVASWSGGLYAMKAAEAK